MTDMPPAEALQNLLDKEAIREVLLRYARGIDRHDESILVSAYHSDATDDHGAFIGGPEAFVEYANRVHGQNWSCHQHYVTNVSIELDGDNAHCESYFLAVLRRPGDACDLVGGRYVDRLERREGCWAIAARACLIEWNVEAESNGAGFDPSIYVAGTQGRDDPSYQRPLELARAPRDLSKALLPSD